ncbi:MAG: alpha/beta hydrolase-fold protein [Chloroflexota bacterium]
MTILKNSAIGFGILIVLLTVGIWLFWEQLPLRLVWPYIAQPAISMTGQVQKHTIDGLEAGEQTFFVYLPSGYEAGEQRYKTLYHLHGAYVQESWAGYDCQAVGAALEKAAAEGIIEPMIVVCLVDPDGDRMWSDSFDNQYLASTALTQDLIPYIDAHYHTISERNGRALQGFSMGGFGTVVNGFRSADLFSAIIIWDGALHDWNTLSTNRQSIASKMFASEAYFKEWSPYEVTKNAADVDLDVFMVVGEMNATRDFASRFRPHLEDTGKAFTYHDVACPHSIFCMMDELGEEAFSFLAASFARQS